MGWSWTANCLQGVKYGLGSRVVAGLRSSSSVATPLVFAASGALDGTVSSDSCRILHPSCLVFGHLTSYVRVVLEVRTCFDVLIYPAFSRGPLPKETLSNFDLEGREIVIIIGNNCNRAQVRLSWGESKN